MVKRVLAITMAIIISLFYLIPLTAIAQDDTNKSEKAGVWKLVEIVDYENKESWTMPATEYWQFKHSYGQGNFSATFWHKDEETYIAYGTQASWSQPPSELRAGEKVLLEATLTETENTKNWNAIAASTYADFSHPERGVGTRGDAYFTDVGGVTDISINSATISSASASFTATVPEGAEGSRIALRIQYYMGASMATYYIYEWQPGKEEEQANNENQKPQKPQVPLNDRPKEIIIEFSDGTDMMIAGTSGQVEISYSGDRDEADFLRREDFKKLKYTDGMLIITGPRSALILSFPDLSTFVVGPETTLVFKKVEIRKETKLELVASNIWVNIKKMVKDGTMEVTMNQGVAGIKGTIFVCEDDGNTSTLKVIEGSVEFTAKADGKKEMVYAGEMISATAEGIGAKTSFDVKVETNKWDEIQASTQKGKFSKGWIGLLSGGVLLLAIIAAVVTTKKKKAKRTHY
jgi:hypothetical protein